jgi:3-dehydroquinate dehydratase-2
MKILILNGPNLNFIDNRPAKHYGAVTLIEIENKIKNNFPVHSFEFFQSNHEGELIDKIHFADNNFDGLIINPGAYSHTSVAIRDALEICSLPKIEVHLSNIAVREDFRQVLITASVCDGYISGFRENSYFAAIYLLERLVNK